MMALTQYLPDLPSREDGEKTSDTRTDGERCQLAFVEFGNLINWHVRLLGQDFDSSLVHGAFARRRSRGKSVHVSLS
jgi:hypothetical protein